MAQLRVPQRMPDYRKSYALLSNAAKADTAVIFVHGFGGKPTSTWRDFQSLADEYPANYPWWLTSDMFFYSYNSLRIPVRRNAVLLGNFVEAVWNGRWKNTPADTSPEYSDLILVGHSEGGVIIRRLILDRYEEIKLATQVANAGAEPASFQKALISALGADFILASYLRLFAPACAGINFSSFAALLDLPFVASVIAASSLVKNELEASSKVLTNLQSGTEEAAQTAFPAIRSLFTGPLFGVPDHIVTSDSYKNEPLQWDPGYGHIGVCKPNYDHTRPLKFVRK